MKWQILNVQCFHILVFGIFMIFRVYSHFEVNVFISENVPNQPTKNPQWTMEMILNYNNLNF